MSAEGYFSATYIYWCHITMLAILDNWNLLLVGTNYHLKPTKSELTENQHHAILSDDNSHTR